MEFELLFMAQALSSEKSACDAEDLVRDMRLDILFHAMSGGDFSIYDACSSVMTRPLTDLAAILSRRAVVQDAIAHGDAFSKLFAISGEAVESVRAHLEFVNPKYDRVIPNGKKIVTETEIAKLNIKFLRSLNAALVKHSGAFSSEAMRGLCRAVESFVAEDRLSLVEARVHQLGALKSVDGLSVSGHIGAGLMQADVLLNDICQPTVRGRRRPGADEVAIPLASMALIRNADEIVENALAPVHRVIAGFNRSIQRFFEKLRFQAGFLVGCGNLRRQLETLGIPLCWPQIASDAGEYAGTSLMDASLALKERRLPAANGFRFTGKRQVVITGPNQGGKTTFLRSVGLAQVMAQCGMFVAAQAYVCPLFSSVFTHFPGVEDSRLQMGLLEVELCKLSGITGALKPDGLLLMNESFQSTMPLDAKQLAEEILSALADAGVTVLFVTHLYAYAVDLYRQRREDVLFLRAQRGQDGKNTYELQEDAPYKTAFGMELFCEIVC